MKKFVAVTSIAVALAALLLPVIKDHKEPKKSETPEASKDADQQDDLFI